MKILLYFLFFSISIGQSIAELSCSKNGTVIFYTNGIGVKGEVYTLQKKEINDLFTNGSTPMPGKVRYSDIDEGSNLVGVFGVHNESSGFMRDLLEVYVQTVGNLDGYRDIYEAFYPVLNHNVELAEEIRDDFGAETRMVATTYLESVKALGSVLTDSEKLAEEYEKALGDKCYGNDVGTYTDDESENCRYKVIGLSHSQGGLFVNSAYEKMDASFNIQKKRFFGAYQIATPASSISAANGIHKTYHNDLVIKPILTSMPSNITIPAIMSRPEWTLDSFVQHSLLDTYLNSRPFNSGLRDEVLNGFGEIAAKLKSNCSQPPNIVLSDFVGSVIYEKSDVIEIDYGETINISTHLSEDLDDPDGELSNLMETKWTVYEYEFEPPGWYTVEKETFAGSNLSYSGFKYTALYKIDVEVTGSGGGISARTFNVRVKGEPPEFSVTGACGPPCYISESSGYRYAVKVDLVPKHDLGQTMDVASETGWYYIDGSETKYINGFNSPTFNVCFKTIGETATISVTNGEGTVDQEISIPNTPCEGMYPE